MVWANFLLANVVSTIRCDKVEIVADSNISAWPVKSPSDFSSSNTVREIDVFPILLGPYNTTLCPDLSNYLILFFSLSRPARSLPKTGTPVGNKRFIFYLSMLSAKDTKKFMWFFFTAENPEIPKKNL